MKVKGRTLLPLRNDSDWPLLVHEIRIRRVGTGPAPCAAIPHEEPVPIDPDRLRAGLWQTIDVRIEIEAGKTVDVPLEFTDAQTEYSVLAEAEVVFGDLGDLRLLPIDEFYIRPKKAPAQDGRRDPGVVPPTNPHPALPNRGGRWRYQRQPL